MDIMRKLTQRRLVNARKPTGKLGSTVYKFARNAVNGKVVGIDFSEVRVRVSRITNKPFIRAGLVVIQPFSLSCLPFPDNMFDLFTALNAHNYWRNLVYPLSGFKGNWSINLRNHIGPYGGSARW
jgi:hypothetical protein